MKLVNIATQKGINFLPNFEKKNKSKYFTKNGKVQTDRKDGRFQIILSGF